MTRYFLTLLSLCLLTPLARGAEDVSLQRAEARNEEVHLSFSSPVVYRTERFNKPARLVMNLYSVRPDGAARDLSRLRAPWLKSVRAEPFLGDSLRVTLYLRGDDTSLEVYGVPPTDTIILTRDRDGGEKRSRRPQEIRPREGRPDPAPSSDSRSDSRSFRDVYLNTPRPTPQQNPERPRPEAAKPEVRFGVQVTRMDFQHGETECRLQLDLTGPVRPQAFLLATDPRRPRLVMDLPNAQVVPAEQTIAVPENPLVSRLRVGVFEHKGARVVFDLKRRVNFSVDSDKETGQVVLSLNLDRSPGSAIPYDVTPGPSGRDDSFGGVAPSLEPGGLQGRTIILDAGHGGHDRGASGHGLVEKHVALDITRRLHSLLKGAGVNSVLTRGNDRFIRLPDRPAVANRVGADAFVAIHLNSTGSARNIWSGTETYYHFQDPICRELAEHIQAHLVQSIGLPDRGARSDSRIAPRMGFSVLRNARVPAVLVEVGYLNHPGDAAKLSNAAFRQRAAEGIMAGLRSYFNKNQQSARRR